MGAGPLVRHMQVGISLHLTGACMSSTVSENTC